MESVPRQHRRRADQFWWAFIIAEKFHLNPHDVKEWEVDEVMEALAYIDMTKPKGGEII